MSRTITVTGIGRATSRPDQITIPITLEARDFDYQKTMQLGAQQHEALKASLGKCEIEPEDIKTTDFRVDASYETERDKNGNYKRVFNGYTCAHQLQVQFDIDMKRLGRVLDAIAKCAAQPRCSIQFGIKDPESMMHQVLENAASNARQKAEILAAASGVKLGELITITYSWTDVTFRSETDMLCETAACACDSMNIEIEPEDIKASENVTFVWDIH